MDIFPQVVKLTSLLNWSKANPCTCWTACLMTWSKAVCMVWSQQVLKQNGTWIAGTIHARTTKDRSSKLKIDKHCDSPSLKKGGEIPTIVALLGHKSYVFSMHTKSAYHILQNKANDNALKYSRIIMIMGALLYFKLSWR